MNSILGAKYKLLAAVALAQTLVLAVPCAAAGYKWETERNIYLKADDGNQDKAARYKYLDILQTRARAGLCEDYAEIAGKFAGFVKVPEELVRKLNARFESKVADEDNKKWFALRLPLPPRSTGGLRYKRGIVKRAASDVSDDFYFAFLTTKNSAGEDEFSSDAEVGIAGKPGNLEPSETNQEFGDPSDGSMNRVLYFFIGVKQEPGPLWRPPSGTELVVNSKGGNKDNCSVSMSALFSKTYKNKHTSAKLLIELGS